MKQDSERYKFQKQSSGNRFPAKKHSSEQQFTAETPGNTHLSKNSRPKLPETLIRATIPSQNAQSRADSRPKLPFKSPFPAEHCSSGILLSGANALLLLNHIRDDVLHILLHERAQIFLGRIFDADNAGSMVCDCLFEEISNLAGIRKILLLSL